MYKKYSLCLLSTISLLLFSNPSIANDQYADIESMKKEIKRLADEVKRLKELSSHERKTSISVNGKSSKSDKELSVTMNPSPKVSYGEFTWQPFGVLQTDAAFFNDDNFDHPDGAEMRRARLGMKGTISKDFAYVMEADFGNSETALINAFISYTGFDNGEIRFGHNRSPYSLEASTSTDDTTFIEFSAPTSAFDVGELIGIGSFFNGNAWSLGLGLYNQNTGLQDNDDEGWRAAGRATFLPVNYDKSLFHIGLSGAYVASREESNSFTFGATAENAIQTTNLVQTTLISDNHTVYGFETAAVYGPFSIQGEYFITDVDTNQIGSDATFYGGYGQVSYFLTGEQRPYVRGNGTFGRIIPHHNLNTSGGLGAWEIAARFSSLDLNDGSATGGKMDSYTLGLNWYPNPYSRLMLNYIDTETDENAFTASDDSPSVVLVRGQLTF